MTTTSSTAERLANAYVELLEQNDERLSGALDRLLEAVAELDVAGGGLESPVVRRALDASPHTGSRKWFAHSDRPCAESITRG
jgi:hypothetical protein